MKKQYGIYIVEEETKPDGSFTGYRCSVVDNRGLKQGKLYLKSDGREYYQQEQPKDKDEELEI